MKKSGLQTSDLHQLRAADGWLDLGDWRSALAELDALRLGARSHPAVLAMRFRAHSTAGQWDLALESAERGLEANPKDPQAWIHRSFALHELKRTREAEALLLPALDNFPTEPIIAYNLACYACVQGELAKARALLARAAAVGNAEEMQRMARNDPDLAALRAAGESV
jgi:Flp pilus assembly protein TadD